MFNFIKRILFYNFVCGPANKTFHCLVTWRVTEKKPPAWRRRRQGCREDTVGAGTIRAKIQNFAEVGNFAKSEPEKFRSVDGKFRDCECDHTTTSAPGALARRCWVKASVNEIPATSSRDQSPPKRLARHPSLRRETASASAKMPRRLCILAVRATGLIKAISKSAPISFRVWAFRPRHLIARPYLIVQGNCLGR